MLNINKKIFTLVAFASTLFVLVGCGGTGGSKKPELSLKTSFVGGAVPQDKTSTGPVYEFSKLVVSTDETKTDTELAALDLPWKLG